VVAFANVGAEIAFTVGRLGDDRFENLVLYHDHSGGVEIYGSEGSGDFTGRRGVLLVPRATHVLATGLIDGPGADLIFYRADRGQARLFTLDERLLITRGPQMRLGRGWTHLVPGTYGPAQEENGRRILRRGLLLYHAGRGAVRVLTGDGRGRLTPLTDGPARHWDTGWTHLIPGIYDETDRRTDLFAYRRQGAQGTGRFFTIDAGGTITPLGPSFPMPAATHIVRGRFRRPSDDRHETAQFVAYNQGAFDRGELPRLDVVSADHQSARVLDSFSFPLGRPGTHLVAGGFAGSRLTDFVLYEQTSGAVRLWRSTDQGPQEIRPEALPSPAAQPPRPPAFQQVAVFNCNGDRRGINVWTRELQAGAAWEQRGFLEPQYDAGGTCPRAGASPLVIPLDDQQYEIVAVDSGNGNCNGQNTPDILDCRRYYTVVRGAMNGATLPINVG
jgi:hypothetical protein